MMRKVATADDSVTLELELRHCRRPSTLAMMDVLGVPMGQAL